MPDSEGSIFQDKHGQWWAQLFIDGKPVRRRAKDERDARKKLRELHERRKLNLKVGSDRQTFEEWYTHWLSTQAADLKPKTLDGYQQIGDRYILPYLGSKRLDQLTAQHIGQWLIKLRAKKLSESTLAIAYRRVRTCLNVAVRQRIIATNPAEEAKAPKPGTPSIKALDHLQVATLLNNVADHRLYAAYVVAGVLGVRQAELIGLRWSNVTLDGDAPRIRLAEQLQRIRDASTGKRQIVRQTPKTAAGVREIPLNGDLVAILRAWRIRQAQERLILGERWPGLDLVFTTEVGTPLQTTNLRRHLRASLKAANLPMVRWHSLRHTAGSVMLYAGADMLTVSKILGHSSPATTAKIYAKVFDERRLQAVDLAAAAVLRRA
ncbi:MAG: tyrosine-type recombinase/integrase [Oscillochloridaceae bacterium umkhey_bin13]